MVFMDDEFHGYFLIFLSVFLFHLFKYPLEGLQHFLLYSLMIDFLSHGGYFRQKNQDRIHETGFVISLGKIIEMVFLIEAMIRLKRKPELSPDIVPEDLHPGDTEESLGFDIALLGKSNAPLGQGLEPSVQDLRVLFFVCDDIDQIGLLPFGVSFQDLPEVGNLLQRPGEDETDLFPR